MGDSLYGGKKSKLSGLSRQFLHARRIEVQLPNGTWIEAESELADDLRQALKSLGSGLVNNLWNNLKSQITSTKLQINSKPQILNFKT